jgi:thioesterase domain-containing protein
MVASAVLSEPDIGIRDDLTDFGMTAARAALIATDLQYLLGRQALPNDLMTRRTVEAIACMYRGKPKTDTWSSLVALKLGDPTLPLVCIHPLGGNVFWYSDIARRLPTSQAVYGLHARGLDLTESVQTAISEMAASYVADMQRKIPHGPYALLGWSFGGIVAFEMARQLTIWGQTTPVLAMCDVGPDDISVIPATEDAAFGLLIHAVRLDADAGELMALDSQQRLQELLRRAVHHRRIPADYTLAHLNRMLSINHAHLAALHAYDFRRYDGDIIVFRADESGPTAAVHAPRSKDLGWNRYVAGDIRLYATTGSHFDSLNRANLDIVAHHLSLELGAALAWGQH